MRQYRQALEADEKSKGYAALIFEKKRDGTFDKIKRAEKLRGQVKVAPTDPKKVMEVTCYKSLEPTLFLEPHKKLIERIDKIKKIKQKITDEGRAPMDVEIQEIAKYNERLLSQANGIVEDVLTNNPDMKGLTSLEKGRIALEFIKMNEQPEDYIMLNRYFERAPQLVEEYTSDEEDLIEMDWSPLKYRMVQIGSKKDL